MADELRLILRCWMALMVLLAASAGSAWLDLGAWNSALNLLIAAAKAAVVAWFFMELRGRDGVIRIAALTGLVILLLLLGLSAADYATRILWRAPWQAPPPRSLAAGCAHEEGPLGGKKPSQTSFIEALTTASASESPASNAFT